MQFTIIAKSSMPKLNIRKAKTEISFSSVVRSLGNDEVLTVKDNDMYSLVKKRNTALASFVKSRNKSNIKIHTTIKDKTLYIWKNDLAQNIPTTFSVDVIIKKKNK
jgi:hypothetical protein